MSVTVSVNESYLRLVQNLHALRGSCMIVAVVVVVIVVGNRRSGPSQLFPVKGGGRKRLSGKNWQQGQKFLLSSLMSY
jgi:hypothetical protein